jgi:hypothetical protein
MSTTKSKSTKTVAEPLKVQAAIESSIEKDTAKKTPKKLAPAKVSATIEEATAVLETSAASAVKTSKKRKVSKGKVIRDSFSFPEQDYRKISELKKTCLAAGIPVKKGEILRAGLLLLAKLNLDELKRIVEQVEKVKTGRPHASKVL